MPLDAQNGLRRASDECQPTTAFKRGDMRGGLGATALTLTHICYEKLFIILDHSNIKVLFLYNV
jgi:hypothetical protein